MMGADSDDFNMHHIPCFRFCIRDNKYLNSAVFMVFFIDYKHKHLFNGPFPGLPR